MASEPKTDELTQIVNDAVSDTMSRPPRLRGPYLIEGEATPQSVASEPEPVAWQDNGERELCRAWAAKLVAKLNTKPDHADDVLWLERLRAALAADPAALLAAEQRGRDAERERAARLVENGVREGRASIDFRPEVVAAAIRKGDAT